MFDSWWGHSFDFYPAPNVVLVLGLAEGTAILFDMETDYRSLGDQMNKLLALTEENNRMLRAMRRDKWIAIIVNLLVWGAILYASYYVLVEYVEPLLLQIQSLQGGLSGEGGVDIQALIEQYRQQFGQ